MIGNMRVVDLTQPLAPGHRDVAGRPGPGVRDRR